ncbi:hypothetical protein [Endozoicomonas sp. ALC066]|uniref:hypothetical protein n=1 Tax=Endozoicomonas sp. ALC066 TaxID=3403078 RepID=UPI003BB513F4
MDRYCVSVRKIPEQTYSLLSQGNYLPEMGDKLVKLTGYPTSPTRVKRHNLPPKFAGYWMAKVVNNAAGSKVTWRTDFDQPSKTLDEAVRKAVDKYEAVVKWVGMTEVKEQ